MYNKLLLMVLCIFPLGIVQSHFSYSSNHDHFNYTRPFPIRMLKFLLSLFSRLMYHISMIAIHVAFLSFQCDKLFITFEKKNVRKCM